MFIFVSVQKTIECITVSVPFALFLCLLAFRQSGVLQASGYSGKKYLAWVRKKGNVAYKRFSVLTLLTALSAAVLGLTFSFAGEWAAVVSLAAYLIMFTVYISGDKKIALRSEVNLTPRLSRLYALFIFLMLCIVYICVTLLNFADYVWGNKVFSCLRYVPLAAFPLFIVPMLIISNTISKIYETPHNNRFIKKAKKKLASSNIKVIGITGSYGKTSTKNILHELLSVKYRVLTTPRSHNTPIGIALSLNNADLNSYDIFIAEMGARHVGDIAELCRICPPDRGLITGVCGQHLETFTSFQSIVRTKAELIEYSKNGCIVADDCFDLFADREGAFGCGCVSNVEANDTGTSFTLTLGGKSVRVKTLLLGRHSAYNIGLAAKLAFELGVGIDEIAQVIALLQPTEHRLQLIKNGGVNIIDDGYNSNVKGARAALETLSYFKGRKIVITPGLVELGVLEESENFELGKLLAPFDVVILVGDTLITPVKNGYLAAGGEIERLKIFPTLAAARDNLKEIVTEGDTVLFLNDLPDVY